MTEIGAFSSIEGGSADLAAVLDDVGIALAAASPVGTIVTNTSRAPYNSIVHVHTTIGGSAWQGSGVLIAPDEVLTAAHMVWTYDIQSSASGIRVSPGETETSLPFGTIGFTDFHFNPINNSNDLLSATQSHSDYALIHLSQPVFTSAMPLYSGFTGGIANVTAYPSVAPFDGKQEIDDSSISVTANIFSGVLNFSPNATFQGRTQQVIEPGSSGGPVWVTDISGRASVVGLISAGSSISQTASWITPDVQSQIVGWYLDDHPSSFAASHDAAESSLFDAAYYLIKYPDIMAAGADPMQHFASVGWTERRNPDSVFDVAYYLAHNPDVARAGIDPLLQYAEYGWKEGRDPSASFSTSHYLAVNADVKLAGIDPLQHYLQFGIAEHRHI